MTSARQHEIRSAFQHCVYPELHRLLDIPFPPRQASAITVNLPDEHSATFVDLVMAGITLDQTMSQFDGSAPCFVCGTTTRGYRWCITLIVPQEYLLNRLTQCFPQGSWFEWPVNRAHERPYGHMYIDACAAHHQSLMRLAGQLVLRGYISLRIVRRFLDHEIRDDALQEATPHALPDEDDATPSPCVTIAYGETNGCFVCGGARGVYYALPFPAMTDARREYLCTLFQQRVGLSATTPPTLLVGACIEHYDRLETLRRALMLDHTITPALIEYLVARRE